jgi:surface antigen Omp85-like protein
VLKRVIAFTLGLAATWIAGTDRAAAEDPSATQKPGGAASKFRSPEDGWLDISGFLDEPWGFIPLLFPITEPAVGYGAGAGMAFVDRPAGEAQAGFGRPNITLLGGLATENDTWGIVAGDLRHWMGDRLQTLVAVIDASVNLDFFGIGEDAALEDDALRYNLRPRGGGIRTKYRIAASRVWVGATYAYADTKVEFEDPSATPGLPGADGTSRVGGLTPSITYDSRDNFFTPTRGTYFEGAAGVFDEWLGGDDAFQRVSLTYLYYAPLDPALTLGVRGGVSSSFGEVPFYLRPYVSLRGAPVLRYQGETIAEVETEARWQFWKRFSIVGFAGYGAAWNDFEEVDDVVTVLTGGTGFRYEMARKYGLHAGLDVAFGPDGTAVYVQFGSAWNRP